MKKILLFLTFIPFLLATNCGEPKEGENCHKTMYFVNKSKKEIQITFSTMYPDSVSHFPTEYGIIASPNGGTAKNKHSDCLENLIPTINKYGVLMVFVFDYNVVKDMDWKEVIEKKLYLKKYDLTVEKLKEMDWTIVYEE